MYGKNPIIEPASAVINTIDIIGESFVANIINNDTHDIIVIPDDKPSRPSIKLIAFVIPTIHPTVSIKLNTCGSTQPLIISIRIPHTHTITADATYAINFCHGFKSLTSSKKANVPKTIIPNKNPNNFIL